MHNHARPKEVLDLKVLPGEPLDGGGRLCIHLFVQDPRGPITEPMALHPALDDEGKPIKQQVVARPTRGRLACDPRRRAALITKGNIRTMTLRTDSPSAVTCAGCLASVDYRVMVPPLVPTQESTTPRDSTPEQSGWPDGVEQLLDAAA